MTKSKLALRPLDRLRLARAGTELELSWFRWRSVLRGAKKKKRTKQTKDKKKYVSLSLFTSSMGLLSPSDISAQLFYS